MDEILNKSEIVTKKLSGCGANIQPYKVPPHYSYGSGLLFRKINKNLIKLYCDPDTNPEVYISKKHKQAIINISETDRVIKNIRAYIYYNTYFYKKFIKGNKPDIVITEQNISNVHLGINIQTEYIKNITITGIEPRKEDNIVYYKVNVSLCPTEFSFLVGIDESAHFISQLPEKATSVEHAHRILRPKEVPKNSLRQGEWFFVPVKNQNELTKKSILREHNCYALEDYSTHYLKGTRYVNTINPFILYVKGTIFDNRKNNHKPLDLSDKIYRVYRNNEVKTNKYGIYD